MPTNALCSVCGKPVQDKATLIAYKAGSMFFMRTPDGEWQMQYGLDGFGPMKPGISCGRITCAEKLEQELALIMKGARYTMGCLGPERERRELKALRKAGGVPPPPLDSASKDELLAREKSRGYGNEALVRARGKKLQAERKSLQQQAPAAAWMYEDPVPYVPSPAELKELGWSIPGR